MKIFFIHCLKSLFFSEPLELDEDQNSVNNNNRDEYRQLGQTVTTNLPSENIRSEDDTNSILFDILTSENTSSPERMTEASSEYLDGK